jgi:hypothetical protein
MKKVVSKPAPRLVRSSITLLTREQLPAVIGGLARDVGDEGGGGGGGGNTLSCGCTDCA